MHKLTKGLKKKKKNKKGKKGEEDEFDPEELERYRRERAEAQQKAEESGEAAAAGSDEWRKFDALTAGVDSILRKTQGDLDRIKESSFFQRVAPVVEKKEPTAEETEAEKQKAKRFLGFDEEGNPIEKPPSDDEQESDRKPKLTEDGFVEVPDDDEEREYSEEEDIFDTTYLDVLQNIDVQLAYIPDSPTEEELGDDPFDTTSADKVLKTVDKRGRKVVSLGNAVEVLAGRVDQSSAVKVERPRRTRVHNLLLEDDVVLPTDGEVQAEPVEVETTLLDDDSDLPDIPIDLTQLPPISQLPRPVTPEVISDAFTCDLKKPALDISEFEVFKERTLLEEIPDLDDGEFDLDVEPAEPVKIYEEDDPFTTKESETLDVESEIIEVSFEAATFVNEEDPFDTAFAENILPGKTELKFIEKELGELSEARITLPRPDPKRTLLQTNQSSQAKKDLLGGSATDLSKLTDQPIAPAEELTYVDPFDTSGVKELPPGQTELKFLEKELLGDKPAVPAVGSLDDDDFDPRQGEEVVVKQAPPVVVFQVTEPTEEELQSLSKDRKLSRPEVLTLGPNKQVGFELPTPSQRPDLLKTGEEEKALPSKPLTPYYSQKSFDKLTPEEVEEHVEVDPFDTSFVAKSAPGKTELKLIESELLKAETPIHQSLSDQDFNPREDVNTVEVGGVKIPLARGKVPLRQAQRQESILDADVEDADAPPLTPKLTSTIDEEDELLYKDPFDTSIATNIVPGKTELKLLENELNQITNELPVLPNPISLVIAKQVAANEDQDFDPRAGEVKEVKDYLCIDEQAPNDKVLTPQDSKSLADEDIDPFDTSFASIGPGKTELKLLETELIEK